MRQLLFILIFCIINSVHAQSNARNELDSLLILVDKTHKVEEKIEHYFKLASLYKHDDYDSSRIMSEFALQLSKQIKSDKNIADAYVSLGLLNVMNDSLDRAVMEYSSSIMYFEKINDLISLADVNIILGNLYYVKGEYPKAMHKYNEALSYSKRIDYKEKLPHCYNNLGVVYFSQKDYKQSLEFFIKALQLFEELNDSIEVALTFGNIGSIYVQYGNLDIAKNYYSDAVDVYESLADNDGIALSLIQLSEIYIINNQPDSALCLLDQSYSLIENIDHDFRGPRSTRLTDLYIKSGKAHMLKKDWENALYNLRKSNHLARTIKLNGSIMESSQLLSQVYDSLRNVDSSYKYFKIYSYYSDSIISEENIRKLAQIEFKYKYEQQIIGSELAEKKKQAQESRKNLIYLIIAGCLVFAIIIFILLLKLEKNKKIKIDLERIKLKRELEYKNKELTTHMLYLLKKNEFILSISEKLKKIIPSIKIQNKKSIAEIINELNAGTSNDTWKEFEVRFQEVHNSFFDNLNNEYPQLSPNELRLCAFLRLNMTTKDIAAITYQSINSIEMARFRLRKKLGVDKEENLISFLSKL